MHAWGVSLYMLYPTLSSIGKVLCKVVDILMLHPLSPCLLIISEVVVVGIVVASACVYIRSYRVWWVK